MGTKSYVCVLHYGHAEYDVSASTSSPEHYGHEEHVYPVLHYDTQRC
jgi:hypothetical protein